MRWRSNGAFKAPAVIRVKLRAVTLTGGAIYRSQSRKVLVTLGYAKYVQRGDARSAALRRITAPAVYCAHSDFVADDPVLFLEHKHLYRQPYNPVALSCSGLSRFRLAARASPAKAATSASSPTARSSTAPKLRRYNSLAKEFRLKLLIFCSGSLRLTGTRLRRAFERRAASLWLMKTCSRGATARRSPRVSATSSSTTSMLQCGASRPWTRSAQPSLQTRR